MAILGRTLIICLSALVSCLHCFPASAETAEAAPRVLRIGLISTDPGRLLHDFDPFAEYFKNSLRSSGIRDVTVFVAKDLEQLHERMEGKLDLIFSGPFPITEMEHDGLVPSVLAVQEGIREHSAVFFVRKKSSLRNLTDLRGKTVVFGTPSSTAGYALAKAELRRNKLSVRESAGWFIPPDAVRYEFAGEPINQAFRVVLNRADAGAFSIDDWEMLPAKQRDRLRIIYRTEPVPRLLGSFSPSVSRERREAVEKALLAMSGNEKGRAALAALHITKFDFLTPDDVNSLLRLKQLLSGKD